MKSIYIGLNANKKPVSITPEMRQNTHMHVIGGSGKGKSKFLEWLIRKDIREGHGLCLIDWHGTLYNSVLEYCAQLDVGLDSDFRKLILLNPSQPEFITGFNPFMNQGADVSVQVRNRVDATIRPWGVSDTNAMPTFEYITTLLYTFAVEQQQTLANSALLLDYTQPELRDYAINVLSSRRSKQGWKRLQMMKSFRDWDSMVLSTENRISRFLGSSAIKRFMGLTAGNINLREIMDQGHILLVNLGSSQFLDREAAKVFASLLLNEFFETSMIRATDFRQRGETPPTFLLYLDEFQEYITDDIAAMLDQVRKGGLHMVLAHQHLGHLADNPKLRKSIFTNARLRAVLGGLDYEDGSILANEMFLPDLNTRKIKKAYYHTIHVYREETRSARTMGTTHGTSTSTTRSSGIGSGTSTGSSFSSTSGSGTSRGSSASVPGTPGFFGGAPVLDAEGWFTESENTSESSSESSSNSSSESSSEFSSEGESAGESDSESSSETEFPVWVPIPTQELGSEAEWSREEKMSKVAEMLIHQMKQHCFIKLDEAGTQPLWIPTVKDYSHLRKYLLEYEKEVSLVQGALPAAEVDHLIAESERLFLTEAAGAGKVIDVEATPINSTQNETPNTPSVSVKKARKPRRSRSARESLFAKMKEPPSSD